MTKTDREYLDRIEGIAHKYYQSDTGPEDAMREIVSIFKPMWMETDLRQDKIYVCTECGTMWDSDGCRVSVVNGVEYIAQYFICGYCKTPATAEAETGG